VRKERIIAWYASIVIDAKDHTHVVWPWTGGKVLQLTIPVEVINHDVELAVGLRFIEVPFS
jgi:hypothetical protein